MYHVPEMRLHYPLVSPQSTAATVPTRNYDNILPSFNELSHQNTINLPFVQREAADAYTNVAPVTASSSQTESGYYCRYYAFPLPPYSQHPQSQYQQAVLPYATIPGNNFPPSSFPMMTMVPSEVQSERSFLNPLHAHTDLPPIIQNSNDIQITPQNSAKSMTTTMAATKKIPGLRSTVVLKPRVITTMWEDESTICYQVEANGISVVRRADNDMINGTKLLNVTKMTRGRRDGILRSEKIREVVKIGSMHLKGVWIPFERAYILAQREQILDHLYPLFVKDIESIVDTNKRNNKKSSSPELNPGNYHSVKQESSENKDKLYTEVKHEGVRALSNEVSSQNVGGTDNSKNIDIDSEAQNRTSRAKNEIT
ncbi:hypothetical protein SEUBUCD646_0K01770 [Saccharomyces eubayanus]|uniref:Transcriptional activator that enhances pseudohyphal growth n=1 Tax=Saccharomyces pastorianus TaxID=27292 RepID=A0A6C1EB92_SACPS|nr:transcriptional activator that enhances pseudohyphal growth [Saccharomyces pastorianus]CAI1568120.1 hypothetical protein SEUBUCD646_0K01770 [Saccharomyces eubayanus]